MNLAWHCRLVTRMINNNVDCTIADYYTIVDKEEENECFESVTRINGDGVPIPNLAVYGVIEREEWLKKESMNNIQEKLEIAAKAKKIRLRMKKKKFGKYLKKSCIA
jgi:hypothetical protein